ncbi:uncharacterized protein EV422DRAFT_526601 [Fimicolochytrium jonesii]|uniref:uncharacterized protein n=1 Tax=Fimicolochytrium jonesii TaxID=1396493 RepID=UPI0022FEDA10|nr:uncharacterized protein EV422DRAFT_526601 [Fimicolochytrium jonesii]KAI8821697.1 hypothetical protein EV422DRAFT_526601 [Fimicolochytrium jonesii]
MTQGTLDGRDGGWKTATTSRQDPRFRTRRGHPATNAQSVIHGAVWTTTTSGGKANQGKFPRPTAESVDLKSSRGWAQYLEFAEHATAHKRMAICHEWIDPTGHTRRRRVVDSLRPKSAKHPTWLPGHHVRYQLQRHSRLPREPQQPRVHRPVRSRTL